MSTWSLLATPFLLQAPELAPAAAEAAAVETLDETLGESDLFAGLASMDETAMSAASGGSHTAIDIGAIGVGILTNDGKVSNTATYGDTGQIANNMVKNNDGITTVFNNTGNGVVFQSNVNVNIFMNARPTGQ